MRRTTYDRIKMGLEMRLTSKSVKAARFELEEHQETLAHHGASPEALEEASSVLGWVRRVENGISDWMDKKKKVWRATATVTHW